MAQKKDLKSKSHQKKDFKSRFQILLFEILPITAEIGVKAEMLVVAMYANVKRLMQSAERTNCVRLSSLALRPLHFRPVVRALQFQTSLKELELPGNSAFIQT